MNTSEVKPKQQNRILVSVTVTPCPRCGRVFYDGDLMPEGCCFACLPEFLDELYAERTEAEREDSYDRYHNDARGGY